MNQPFHIFICYAREDAEARASLRRKLAPLQQSGKARVWYDGEIVGGQQWDQEIRRNLKSADIVLLLISDDFFDSDYIDRVELKEALEAYCRGENTVVPVILYDCIWQVHPELAQLQALPTDAKPIYKKQYWENPDEGFADVAKGIVKILESEETAKKRLKRKVIEKLTKGMVFVKGGTFRMGCTSEQGGDCRDAEKPAHEATVSDFYLGRYEVTFEEYDAFCAATGRQKPDDRGWGRGKRPVINVSWYDAVEYCNWLSEQQGLTPYYAIDKSRKDLNNDSSDDYDDLKWLVTPRVGGNGYRLPTEAEWEYAARGGAKSKGYKYAGSNNLDEVAWFEENSGRETRPVGEKNPNELGLYDLSGNVWEWCWDWYGDYSSSSKTNPRGPESGSGRVLRGGSCSYIAEFCRVSYRSYLHPDSRYDDFGFRVAFVP